MGLRHEMVIFTLTVLTVTLLSFITRAAESRPSDEVIARSVVSTGDLSRLQAVMDKGRRGEPLSIVVMGGSITAGSAASSSDKSYGNLMGKWWKSAFPASKIRFTNAGIGATGSDYGALRVVRDVAKANPDFVVVEFAVNDNQTPDCTRSMEGLVRQLLKMDGKPAVMLLYTMHEDGTNAQKWHTEIGLHYGLPMISMRDALWPEIKANRLNYKDVQADEVHPNNLGHSYISAFLTEFLGKVLAQLPASENIKVSAPMPQPLHTDYLEYTSLFEGRALKPVKAEGWSYNGTGWRSKAPGSVMEFEITGREIYFMASHVNGPEGMIKVQVDQLQPVIIDCWFDQTWGIWKRLDLIASNLDPGMHTVKVELLSDRNPNSKGNEVIVNAIGSAGVGR